MVKTTFFDIPISGNKLPDGRIKVLNDSEALENAFKLWLSYAARERYRTTAGGWLINHLGKQMNEERSRLIQQSITGGLSKFSPELTIISFNITPLYEKKQWPLEIIAYSSLLQLGLNSNLIINNEV